MGGGWTMFLHSMWGGCVHSNPKYKQSMSDWERFGINHGPDSLQDYADNANNYFPLAKCYFLPLRYWKAIATTSSSQGATTLRFTARNGASFDLPGFHMTNDRKYGIRSTNRGLV